MKREEEGARNGKRGRNRDRTRGREVVEKKLGERERQNETE